MSNFLRYALTPEARKKLVAIGDISFPEPKQPATSGPRVRRDAKNLTVDEAIRRVRQVEGLIAEEGLKVKEACEKIGWNKDRFFQWRKSLQLRGKI